MASLVKSLLHLILAPGSLLHGITKFHILILLLHLSVNLLYEYSPLAHLASASLLRTLSCATSSCATSSCASHIILI